MSDVSNTPAQPDAPLAKLDDSLVPNLSYEHGRWSTTRENKVERIKEKWDARPDLVLILSDPKLKGTDLALVRNDRFQQLQKVVRDLVSGEATVVHNIQMMLHAVSIIKDRLHERELDNADRTLQKALQIVTAEAKVLSQVYTRSPRGPIEPTPLSEEDRAMLAEIDAE